MENGWYLIPQKKLICRKRIPIISFLLAQLGFRQTRMIELYSMIKRSYHSPNTIERMMNYSFPLEHDNFPKPDKYPYYYRLKSGWSIEKQSVIYLKDGPLFSENSKFVIVHSRVFVKSLVQYTLQIISLIALLVGIPAGIITIKQYLGI